MHAMQRNRQDQNQNLRTAERSTLYTDTTRALSPSPRPFEFTPMTVKARLRVDMSIGCFCGSVPSVGILLFALLLDLDSSSSPPSHCAASRNTMARCVWSSSAFCGSSSHHLLVTQWLSIPSPPCCGTRKTGYTLLNPQVRLQPLQYLRQATGRPSPARALPPPEFDPSESTNGVEKISSKSPITQLSRLRLHDKYKWPCHPSKQLAATSSSRRGTVNAQNPLCVYLLMKRVPTSLAALTHLVLDLECLKLISL